MADPPTHSHVQEPLSLAVAQEGAELAGEDVVVDGDQEVLVELEGRGKLGHELPHAVQELGEDGRSLLGISCQVTTPTVVCGRGKTNVGSGLEISMVRCGWDWDMVHTMSVGMMNVVRCV